MHTATRNAHTAPRPRTHRRPTPPRGETDVEAARGPEQDVRAQIGDGAGVARVRERVGVAD
eukprot:1625740-Alexandrium_andersonii.AAC.1